MESSGLRILESKTMNDITEMTAVMLAAENGARIQYQYRETGDLEWRDVQSEEPVWNWGAYNYRVAQEQDDE